MLMLIRHAKQELRNYYHMVTKKYNNRKIGVNKKWQELKQQLLLVKNIKKYLKEQQTPLMQKASTSLTYS
jgi:hypothetical protein